MDSTVPDPISVGGAAGLFKSAVQAFDELFERPEFYGDLIVIRKPDDLRDEDIPVFSILNCWAARGYAPYPSAMNFRAFPGNSLNLSKAMRMVRMQGATSREVEIQYPSMEHDTLSMMIQT